MQLRNKKTGEIVKDVCSFDTRYFMIGIEYENNKGFLERTAYHSLAELNEEWEDYEPKEPLIKDGGKIESLKHFSCLVEIRTFKFKRGLNCFYYKFPNGVSYALHFPDGEGLGDIENDRAYDITELCGESEK